MDFWSYPAKAQQAVKVRVTVNAPCSPLTDPDPIRTESGPRARWLQGAEPTAWKKNCFISEIFLIIIILLI